MRYSVELLYNEKVLAYAVWLMPNVASREEIHNHVWLGPLKVRIFSSA